VSYQTVISALHDVFEEVEGIEAVLPYEPTSIQAYPTLYSLLDKVERSSQGQLVIMRYRILHRLCFRWVDNETAEAHLIPFVNSIPAAVDQDPMLGGALPLGIARISEIQAVFVEIGGTLHRALDFYSDVLEKAPAGSGV
jgi:hypothetical protein